MNTKILNLEKYTKQIKMFLNLKWNKCQLLNLKSGSYSHTVHLKLQFKTVNLKFINCERQKPKIYKVQEMLS